MRALKILITGANGFIGRSFFRFLDRRYRNFEIFGLDIKPADRDKRKVVCDLNDRKELFSFLSKVKPEYIFHFAGGRIPDDKKIFQANFLTTQSLFDVVGANPHFKPRILIPGTAAEYGRPRRGSRLINERVPAQPGSWYGRVKYQQTSLGLAYARRGFDVVVARMFNILGEGVPPSLAIGKFAQEIAMIEKKMKPPVIHTKNLKGKRDFLDIEDICSALLSIALYGKKGEIYNVCSGKACPIRTLLDKLLSYSNVKNIVVDEDGGSHSESYDVIGSNAKLKAMTGWKSKISIERSLKRTLNYYRKIYR